MKTKKLVLEGFTTIFHFEHDSFVSLHANVHRVENVVLSSVRKQEIEGQDGDCFVRDVFLNGTDSKGRKVQIAITLFSGDRKSLMAVK